MVAAVFAHYSMMLSPSTISLVIPKTQESILSHGNSVVSRCSVYFVGNVQEITTESRIDPLRQENSIVVIVLCRRKVILQGFFGV